MWCEVPGYHAVHESCQGVGASAGGGAACGVSARDHASGSGRTHGSDRGQRDELGRWRARWDARHGAFGDVERIGFPTPVATVVKVVTSVTQQLPAPAGPIASQTIQAAGTAVDNLLPQKGQP